MENIEVTRVRSSPAAATVDHYDYGITLCTNEQTPRTNSHEPPSRTEHRIECVDRLLLCGRLVPARSAATGRRPIATHVRRCDRPVAIGRDVRRESLVSSRPKPRNACGRHLPGARSSPGPGRRLPRNRSRTQTSAGSIGTSDGRGFERGGSSCKSSAGRGRSPASFIVYDRGGRRDTRRRGACEFTARVHWSTRCGVPIATPSPGRMRHWPEAWSSGRR